MPRIALLCAYNTANTGMFTVDFAARAFLANHPAAAAAEVTHFTVEGDYATRSGDASIAYRRLRSLGELEEFDAIIHWGDFLHARRYYLTDLYGRQLRATPGTTPAQARRRTSPLANLLIMHRAPDHILRRTICFGGSIYINSRADEADSLYRAAIGRLYAKAALVTLRDPVSAHFAHRYAGPAAGPTFGVDCAFLLKPTPGFAWTPGPRIPARRLGFSFGRNLSRSRDSATAMRRFAETLARRFGFAELRDIAWLEGIGPDAARDVAGKLAAIGSCDAIVTDTYHCAVNAWREGVPALCIGLGADHPGHTLSEKK